MRSLLLVLTAAAVLTLAACASGSAASRPPNSTSESASPGASTGAPNPTPVGGGPEGGLKLDGRTFIGTRAEPAAPGDVAKVRLSFKNGMISGSGGCNSMSGAYQVVGGVLTAAQLATTEMACPEPAMKMDTWLATLLSGATVKLDGDILTLSRDGVTLTLTDRTVAQPDLPLAQGTNWVLDGIGQGDTVSSVPAGVTSTLTFEGSQANVAFGCNSGGGEFGMSDATFTFGPLVSTRMACGSPKDDVERIVQGALVGQVPYTLNADTLVIVGANGATLTYKGTPRG